MGRPRELTEDERQQLLADGYRPVEVWVPDFDSPIIQNRMRTEAKAIAEADRRSGELDRLEETVEDLWDDFPA
jgi:t-SNARE complex subunit (syntaxin)